LSLPQQTYLRSLSAKLKELGDAGEVFDLHKLIAKAPSLPETLSFGPEGLRYSLAGGGGSQSYAAIKVPALPVWTSFELEFTIRPEKASFGSAVELGLLAQPEPAVGGLILGLFSHSLALPVKEEDRWMGSMRDFGLTAWPANVTVGSDDWPAFYEERQELSIFLAWYIPFREALACVSLPEEGKLLWEGKIAQVEPREGPAYLVLIFRTQEKKGYPIEGVIKELHLRAYRPD